LWRFGIAVARRSESMFSTKGRLAMINFSKWAGACVLVTLLVVSFANTRVLAQDDAKTFEGVLVGLDPNAKVLTLKAGEMEMQFTYTEQTEILGPQKDAQGGVAVKQGSKLKVQYRTGEKANVATRIEVTEL
jgi:hypothetical protein